VGTGPVTDFNHGSLVATAGRRGLLAEEAEARRSGRARASAQSAAPVLEVTDLRSGALAGVSFNVSPGEIVGIAGLTGSGRDNVLGAVFGALPRAGGAVTVAGKPLPAVRPDLAIGQGVAYLAPDRKIGGGVMTMTARENLTLPQLKPFWTGLVLRRKLGADADQGVV